MFRNLTSKQVIVTLTIGIFLLHGVMFFFLYYFNEFFTQSKYHLLLIGLYLCLVLLSSYLLIKTLLNQFIFEKVKILYKLIGSVKSEVPTSKNKDLGTTSIEDVNREVATWAENTSNEISSLKSLEEYRKQYVGVISHELKTPIFTLQGYIHTLLEGGLYDEKINLRYLQRAAHNIDRLETIVEDLELINTLESGQNELILTNFDIVQLIKDVVLDLKSFADEKEMTIIFKDGVLLNLKVKADIDKIRQVIINLVTNSIKYGKEHGTTEINIYKLDENVLVEISDNGIGIEEKHQKHLFDRFYRVDPSRSRMLGGSGLGLSIVKHIIEAHNQTINVRSEIGKGSTFGFTLQIS